MGTAVLYSNVAVLDCTGTAVLGGMDIAPDHMGTAVLDGMGVAPAGMGLVVPDGTGIAPAGIRRFAAFQVLFRKPGIKPRSPDIDYHNKCNTS